MWWVNGDFWLRNFYCLRVECSPGRANTRLDEKKSTAMALFLTKWIARDILSNRLKQGRYLALIVGIQLIRASRGALDS